MSQTVVVRQAGDAAADEDDEQKKDWKFGRNEGGMSWGWKLCAAILYMLPWVDVTEKTVYFIERFPVFAWTEYFTGGCTVCDGWTSGQAAVRHMHIILCLAPLVSPTTVLHRSTSQVGPSCDASCSFGGMQATIDDPTEL
jgi:hypothetical protein